MALYQVQLERRNLHGLFSRDLELMRATSL